MLTVAHRLPSANTSARYENASGDKPIDLADVDLGPELDLDVTRPCPQLDF